MEPITRQEMFLAKAGGQAVNLIEPITREEMFLAKLAGQDVSTPEPYTRREMLLKAACDNAGSGGGGGVNAPLVAITYEVSGGDVLISYETVENNEIVSKAIDAPGGSGGTLSVFRLAGIHISSKEIEDDWTGDTLYPAVQVNSDYYVGGTGHSYDVIWIPSFPLDDGTHFTITVGDL